jgi:hypothetical protein
VISVHDPVRGAAFGELRRFRREFYRCLTARADAVFELTDAVLCADGPVRSLAELSLVGEHRRGHGSSYAALADGRVDIERLRTALAGVPLPRAADGRLVLAVDITCWLRPDAHTSPGRILCHTYGRGKDQHIMIPGWPYSMVVALEPGRSSWTAPLDAQRLAPGDDAATVTATQLRQLVGRLVAAGQWRPGDPDILIVADAGYDGPRLAWLLRDLPVQLLARMRADRVLRRPAPPWIPHPHAGRPPRHGGEFVFGDPGTWGAPAVTTQTDTRLYGTATALAWDRLHPRLTRRAAWTGCGELPIIAGTVIRLQVDRLPSGAIPKPVWLWWSGVDAADTDVDRLWQAFLRRFDIEHTFRMLKQNAGLDLPEDPHPAGRRPLDLAHPRRLHPAPAGPTTRRRPPPPVGETRGPRTAFTRPGPPRLSAPAHEDRMPRRRTETLPTRPRTATRPTQHQTRPTPRRPPRHHRDQHKEIGEEDEDDQTSPPTNRLKIKIQAAQRNRVDVEEVGRQRARRLRS